MTKGRQGLSMSQRLMIEVGVYVLVSIILIFALLLPARKKYFRAREDYLAVQGEIARIEGLLPPGQDITTGLTNIQDQIEKVDQRFPDKEELGVKLIADMARKNKIEILSLRPGARRQFLDSSSVGYEMDGKTCQLVTVSLNGSGTFADLVRFLVSLDDNPELFTSIDQLETDRASAEGALTIRMAVSYYLMK